MEFCVDVPDFLLTTWLLNTFTKLLKILTCLRADVLEELNNDLGSNTGSSVDVHVDIGSTGSLIDSNSVSIGCQLLVD